MNTTKTNRTLAGILAVILCLFCTVSCQKQINVTGMWENAVYTADTTVGEGTKTVTLTVKVEEQSVVLTVKTDADTVGAALLENSLIAGEDGEYGLYIKTVNGMTADYDTDGCYWAFYEGDAYALTGVDGTALTDGGSYMLSCEK